MTAEIDVDRAMVEIKERLTQRFPDRSPQEIGDVVDELRSGMADAKVKDFVPVLIEKSAKKRLKALAG